MQELWVPVYKNHDTRHSFDTVFLWIINERQGQTRLGIIQSVVEMPVFLSKHQNKLLKEFAKEEDEKANIPQSFGFFRKQKDLFS